LSWLEAIVLGLIQGLTEFLPISSSAHLRVRRRSPAGTTRGRAFTAVTQIGTETAVVLYFRKKIGRILVAGSGRCAGRRTWRDDPDSRMGWLVIIGTLPIANPRILFQDQIDHAFRDLRLIAFTLIFFGILLGVADLIGYRFRTLDDHLTVPHGIWFGLAQALALIPGVSRSGGTITAGRLLGYKREEAAEYAFLLAVPAVFASGFYKLADIGGSDSPPWGPTIAATIVAFVVGYVVITWLMAFIKKAQLHAVRGLPAGVGRADPGAGVGTGALDPNAGPTP